LPPGSDNVIFVLASTPDGAAFTIASAPVAPGDSPAQLSLKLPNGEGVTGIVRDELGNPVAGATVMVTRFGGASNDPKVETESPMPAGSWPPKVVTGADGRFKMAGLDPAVGHRLAIHHPERGIAGVVVAPHAAKVTVRLKQLVTRTGQVLADDTESAIPGARLCVTANLPEAAFVQYVTADANGKFVVRTPRGVNWTVRAIPANSPEYLSAEITVLAVPNAKTETDAGSEPVVLRLPRGRVIRGQVVSGESGQPVARAKVWFYTRSQELPLCKLTLVCGIRTSKIADEQGKFELTVPSAECTVLAAAPSHEFIPLAIDVNVLYGKKPAGVRVVAHASQQVNATQDQTSGITLRLTPGRTLEGLALRADGSPVPDGRLICQHIVGERDLQTLVPLPVRNGRFTIPGCRPGQSYAVQVIDPDGGQGAATQLRCPTRAGEVAEIRLAPLGNVSISVSSATRRSVDGCLPVLRTILPSEGFRPTTEGQWWETNPALSPAGREGDLVIRGLIPGASYELQLGKEGAQCINSLQITSGKTTVLRLSLPVQ
jgi:hypothetical protein